MRAGPVTNPIRIAGVIIEEMTARRGTAIASAALTAAAFAVVLVTSGRAETAAPATIAASAKERPRGVVEDCSTTLGWGRRDEFTRWQNLIVGPLAIERGALVWGYNEDVGGDKLFVYVRGGHRVTLELSPETRRNAGLVFGHFTNANVRLENARRVVRFIACQRGERSGGFDGWPVTSWLGGLLISSPRCVPLLIWVDDEPRPRRAVIRFGESDCG